VPVAAPALLGASFVAFFLPGAGEAVGGVLMFAALALCAATLASLDVRPQRAVASAKLTG
jgi:hypothetical protein